MDNDLEDSIGEEIDEELLGRIDQINLNREAVCYFMSILQRKLRGYHKKIEFGPNALEFIFRKFTLNPVYCELLDENEEILVTAYDNRAIQVMNKNPYLIKTCRELSNKTNGNIKVYLKEELKFLY